MNNLYQILAGIPVAGQIILNLTRYKIIMCKGPMITLFIRKSECSPLRI